MTLVKFTSVPRAKLGVSLSLQLFSLGPTEFATLRLRGRLGRDGCQVHCGTVLRPNFQHCGKFVKTVPQCTFTTSSTRSPAQPQSGEYSMHTNETFRANKGRHGHSRTKERRYDCCSSSYGGIYWLCGIISKLYSAIECIAPSNAVSEWWFHGWWASMSHLHRLHRPSKPKLDWQASKDPLKSWEQRINLRYLLH